MKEKWLLGSKIIYGLVAGAVLGAIINLNEFKPRQRINRQRRKTKMKARALKKP